MWAWFLTIPATCLIGFFLVRLFNALVWTQ